MPKTENTDPKLISVDTEKLAPRILGGGQYPGIDFVQGDIQDVEIQKQIREKLGSKKKADIILSDLLNTPFQLLQEDYARSL